MFNAATIRFASIALAVVALTSAPAHAANPNKLALDKFTKDSAALLKTFKGQLKQERKLLELGFVSIDAKLDNSTATTADATQMFNLLEGLQFDTRGMVEQFNIDVAAALGSAMMLLPDQGVDAKLWPKGFRMGDGGYSDKLHGKADAAIRSYYAAIDKRCRLMIAKFETKVHLGICLRIQPAAYIVESATVPGGAGMATALNPLTIDLALTVSNLTLANDGTIHLGGGGFSNDNAIRLFVNNPNGSGLFNTFTVGASHRWTQTLSSRPEGTFQFDIEHQQGNYAGAGIAAISVR